MPIHISNVITLKFSFPKFHSLCDGKGKTLTVIKTTTDYILGGYTSLNWTSVYNPGVFQIDYSAFLYTITNPSNMSLKLAISRAGSAIYNWSPYGASFGCWDIHISDQSNSNTNSKAYSYSYAFPNGSSGVAGGNWITGGNMSTGGFQTVEVEVYLVT